MEKATEYKLLKVRYKGGEAKLSAGSLSTESQAFLWNLLGMPDGSPVRFDGEPHFLELDQAGYLRLVINRRPPSGEISSRVCHVSPFPLWRREVA